MGPSHAPLLPHSRGGGSSSARRGSVAARAFTATAATATGFGAIGEVAQIATNTVNSASWASFAFPLAVAILLVGAAWKLFQRLREKRRNSTARDVGGGDAAAAQPERREDAVLVVGATGRTGREARAYTRSR